MTADWPLYSADQVRQAEDDAVRRGTSLWQLMQQAGQGLAEMAKTMVTTATPEACIFAGNGNNGGDGYVCAKSLLEDGWKVTVYGVAADRLAETGLVRAAADEYLSSGGQIVLASQELDLAGTTGDLIVDALFGTGLTRPVSGVYAHLVGLINAAPVPVLACDLPSGIEADTGAVMGLAVKADHTVMIGLAKLACGIPPGSSYFGQLSLHEIGLAT